VRFMTGRANISQFGWGLFTSMRYEKLADMPPCTPALEGRGHMSLPEFKKTKYFRGVMPNHDLLVFSFIFEPLGSTHAPYPRLPSDALADMEERAPACCFCDVVESRFAHSCLTCGSHVHGTIRGCSVPPLVSHPDYDEDNEMQVVCKNCSEAGDEVCQCGEKDALKTCDLCGECVCLGCAVSIPPDQVEDAEEASGLMCAKCGQEHEVEVIIDLAPCMSVV
jgi:hypothetical protein